MIRVMHFLPTPTLHFLERRCGGDLCREFDHVWPADRLFHRRHNGVKRLPGDYAAPLYVDLMSLHFRFDPSFGGSPADP